MGELQFNRPQAEAVPSEGKGQADPKPQAQQTTEQPAAPQVDANKPMTWAEISQLLDERDRRSRQSVRDTVEAVIQKEVQKLAQPGQPAQVQVAPSQAEPSQQQAGQPVQQGSAPQEQAITEAVRQAQVNEAIRKIQANGLQYDDSPEWGMIDQTTQDGATFQASVDKAIQALAKRRAVEGSPSRMPSIGSTGTPSSNPIQNITDPAELIKMGLNRQGGLKRR